MSVKELIQEHYLTRNTSNLVNLIIKDRSLVDELVEIAISDLPHPFPEHASWIILHILKKDPKVVEAYQDVFIDRILVSTNQSVLRNLTNVTVSFPLISYRESEFLERLIDLIKDNSNKVALFVYAIYKLIQFTQKYPEIKSEIEGIIALKQSQEIQPAIRIGIRNYLKQTENIRL